MLFHYLLVPFTPLTDVWSDLVKQLQDSKTWDFLINIAYAAAIGIGGFVVRRFGLKIRKNATVIGEITSDVLTITKENEQLKAENAQLKVERDQLKTDYAQQQDSYRMIDRLFEISTGQQNDKIRSLEERLAEAREGGLPAATPTPAPNPTPAPAPGPAGPVPPTPQ